MSCIIKTKQNRIQSLTKCIKMCHTCPVEVSTSCCVSSLSKTQTKQSRMRSEELVGLRKLQQLHMVSPSQRVYELQLRNKFMYHHHQWHMVHCCLLVSVDVFVCTQSLLHRPGPRTPGQNVNFKNGFLMHCLICKLSVGLI